MMIEFIARSLESQIIDREDLFGKIVFVIIEVLLLPFQNQRFLPLLRLKDVAAKTRFFCKTFVSFRGC